MKTYVIYHSADLDGFCSGAITKKFLLEHQIPEEDIVMIGWNYGQPTPEIPDGRKLYMTDISLGKDFMSDVFERCDVTWIDHHKSAMIDAEENGYSGMKGKREIGNSASLLAWIYFYGHDIPELVYWVDRYDVLKQTDEFHPDRDWEKVMQMQYGMRHWLKNPVTHGEFSVWMSCFTWFEILPIFETGVTIIQYEKETNKIRCSKAFDLQFEGLKFAAINNCLAGSVVLDSYARDDHDALMVFSYTGTKWTVSLYRNSLSKADPDLSLIAVKYGGGGHSRACGFQVEDINTIIGTISWRPISFTLSRSVLDEELERFKTIDDQFIRICIASYEKCGFKSMSSFRSYLQDYAISNNFAYSNEYDKEENPDNYKVTISKTP